MARKKKKSAPAKPRLSARDKLLLLAQREVPDEKNPGDLRPISRREIARRLRVSTSTVYRLLKGGKLSPKLASAQKRLDREYAKDRDAIRKAERRDAKKHKRKVKASKLPRVLRGTRRKLNERIIDKKTGAVRDTGRKIESSWTNYSVKGFSFREVFEVLKALWQDGRVVQLIFEIPRGARYPVGRDGKRPGLKTRKKTRSATSPEALWLMESEEEVMNFLAGVMPMEPSSRGLKMLYVAVDDNKPRGGK